MSYCVYLKHRQALPVEPVSRLVISATGLTLADGQQIVRRCQGFLIEHLELNVAQRLVEQLQEMNIEAECRQIRDLTPNPRVIHVRAIKFTPERCILQDWKSQDLIYPWEDIFLLSVSCLEELQVPEDFQKKGAKNLLFKDLEEALVEPRDKKVLLLDFFMGDPKSHFRIQSTEFRYDYLGSRMEQSSVANFVSMLHDFHSHTQDAYKDEGFMAAFESKWDEVPSFTAVYEVDEYHRWLLQTFPVGFCKAQGGVIG